MYPILISLKQPNHSSYKQNAISILWNKLSEASSETHLQTTKFGRVKFQCTYDTQIGAVGEATYEIGSEFTSEVEAVADKSIAANDLIINIYGQSAGSAVWQVKAGSLNLSEKIKLEIEDAPTKNKLATHT